MAIDSTALGALLRIRTRQWRFVRLAIDTNATINDGTIGRLDTPLSEEAAVVTGYDQADLRKGVAEQLGFTNEFKRDLEAAKQTQVSAAASMIVNDIPKLVTGSGGINARDLAGILAELDADMQRNSVTFQTNTVSVTAPAASANNAFTNSTVLFASIHQARGIQDLLTYEANQAVASSAFAVQQTSFDGLNGRHRFQVRANRGILDNYDDQFQYQPVSFTVSATRETTESAATTTPARSNDNMVGNGTLTGSSTSVFGWTASGTMFKWDTTTPLTTSPNNNASSFLFSGGAGVVTTMRQAIPFQNASSTKFVIGDTTFCGFSYRMSGNTTGSVKFWFGFEDAAGAGQARIVTLTSTSNGTTWRTSGGFIHAPRDATAAVVRITASSNFDGRCWVGDICWAKVAPDPATGMIVVPRRGHNQSRVGDRWDSGATANNEAGRIQTFFARNFGRGLNHSGTPSIADPT